MHNNELLKELMQQGKSTIEWSRLIESGFKEDCFVLLAYHNNSSESIKIGNYRLVRDNQKDDWHIEYTKYPKHKKNIELTIRSRLKRMA